MSAHTPGPWKATLHGRAAYVEMFIGKADLPPSATGMAQFGVQPYVRPAEALANARLVAAAPDLLSALTDAYASLCAAETAWTEQGQALIVKIQAALAKAEGGSP